MASTSHRAAAPRSRPPVRRGARRGARAGVTVRDLGADEMAEASALLAEVWRTRPAREPDGTRPAGRAGLRRQLRQRRLRRRRDDGRRVRRLPRRTRSAALLHSHVAAVRPGGPPRHRHGAQAPPARLVRRPRHRRHRLDLRPAHRPERVVQPGPARRARRGVPRRLLRPDGRRPQRRRGERPAARALAGRARGGDAAAPSRNGPTPRWPSAPTARPVARPGVPVDAETVTLAVPADVEALRGERPRRRPRRAGAATFREAYADLHEQGWRVRGFVQDGPLRARDRPHQRTTESP